MWTDGQSGKKGRGVRMTKIGAAVSSWVTLKLCKHANTYTPTHSRTHTYIHAHTAGAGRRNTRFRKLAHNL